MDTTTHKAEALALLALDELTDEQRVRLHILTAAEAGHRIIETPDGLRVQMAEVFGYDENGAGMHVYPLAPVRSYTTSIDACTTLPRMPGEEWRIYIGASVGNGVSLGNWIASKEITHDIPRAMLVCWWMTR